MAARLINPVQSKNRARPMAARLIINPVQSKNRARPMAARFINPVQSNNRARPMAARLKTQNCPSWFVLSTINRPPRLPFDRCVIHTCKLQYNWYYSLRVDDNAALVPNLPYLFAYKPSDFCKKIYSVLGIFFIAESFE